MKGQIGWSMDCVERHRSENLRKSGGGERKKAGGDSHAFTEQRESRLTTIPESELFPSQSFL